MCPSCLCSHWLHACSRHMPEGLCFSSSVLLTRDFQVIGSSPLWKLTCQGEKIGLKITCQPFLLTGNSRRKSPVFPGHLETCLFASCLPRQGKSSLALTLKQLEVTFQAHFQPRKPRNTQSMAEIPKSFLSHTPTKGVCRVDPFCSVISCQP